MYTKSMCLDTHLTLTLSYCSRSSVLHQFNSKNLGKATSCLWKSYLVLYKHNIVAPSLGTKLNLLLTTTTKATKRGAQPNSRRGESGANRYTFECVYSNSNTSAVRSKRDIDDSL